MRRCSSSCGSRCVRAGPTTRRICARTDTSEYDPKAPAAPAPEGCSDRLGRPGAGLRRPMATRSPRAPLTAFVLHRYDWSESSVILDLFTREQGRLAVAAKGAKKPYSNFRSVLLPFQRVHVSLSGTAAKDESS